MANWIWDIDAGWMAWRRAWEPSYDRAIRETLRADGRNVAHTGSAVGREVE